MLEHLAIAKQSKEDGVMSHSSSGKGRDENVAEAFRSLQDVVGDWFVDELTFRAPDAEPIVNTGRTMCRAAIGRLAVVAINEIQTSGERTASLITFNPRDERFEFVFVNSLSDVGIIPMTGQLVMTRSSEAVRARFGKAAMVIREFTLAENFSVEPGITIERIVENKISNDLWVLQFFARAPHGEFLIRQQVLTRVQPGCQPQLGCELGCPGLAGCQQGCEGLQGPQGQAQVGCGGQAQLGCQAQMMAQARLVTRCG
jgi:hypothetical protein